MSRSTHASYNRAVVLFLQFLARHFNKVALPASVQHVAAFIAHLSLLGRAPATIATYMSAISYKHKIELWPDPTDNFLIKKLVEGSKRTGGSRRDHRSPITYAILQQLILALPQVCKNKFECTLFQAAFALAYFCFLRIGEFSAQSKNAMTNLILQRQDVQTQANTMRIIIRHAKNNQRNIPVTIEIEGLQGSQCQYCPVILVARYLHSQPSVTNGPLFQHFDKSPLTRFQFQAVLKKAVSFCGLNSVHYKSHAFRIGAATSCAMNGISVAQIKSWGRWSSSAYRSYIRPTTHVLASSLAAN